MICDGPVMSASLSLAFPRGSEVSSWVGSLVSAGRAPSTAARYLRVLRSLLQYAVNDGRIRTNVAASVKPPSGGRARREGQFLMLEELYALERACVGDYACVVRVLGLAGPSMG